MKDRDSARARRTKNPGRHAAGAHRQSSQAASEPDDEPIPLVINETSTHQLALDCRIARPGKRGEILGTVVFLLLEIHTAVGFRQELFRIHAVFWIDSATDAQRKPVF